MADKQAAPATAVPDPKVDLFEDDDEFEEFENEGQSIRKTQCSGLWIVMLCNENIVGCFFQHLPRRNIECLCSLLPDIFE